MPFINNLKGQNNEPVYILKRDWLALINAGIIGPKTNIVYYILDDFVDPEAPKTFVIGEGLILEDETLTVSVDKEWLANEINNNPNIHPNNVDGYGIWDPDIGGQGIITINSNGEVHIGDTLIFHGYDDILGKLYLCEDGSIGSEHGYTGDLHGMADRALGDQYGQNIDDYIKALQIDNGNIGVTLGNGEYYTVPLPAGTAYQGGTGIDVTDSIITNTGVTSINTGANAGTLIATVNGSAREVSVKGLTDTNGTPAVDGSSAGYTTGGASVLRNFGYGSAAATTSNCPAGSIYGRYEDV